MTDKSGFTIDLSDTGTLDGLFRERIRISPELIAYRHYDRTSQSWRDLSWRKMGERVSRWQQALATLELEEGDRVALMLKNGPDWVAVDQAVLGLGLVDVPLYTDDRPDNIVYILRDSGSRALILQDKHQWRQLAPHKDELKHIKHFIILEGNRSEPLDDPDERVVAACDWLPAEPTRLHERGGDTNKLASIVYTSGTTGRPKGVMISHRNFLSIAYASYQGLEIYEGHLFLSFLPLSHTFERTCGYYAPMMCAATVAYARSVQQLANDIQTIRPTVIISVPRIFERIYDRLQEQLAQQSALKRGLFKLTAAIGWRRFLIGQGRAWYDPTQLLWPLLKRLVASKLHDKLGGRVELAVSGGAALPLPITKLFLGLGFNLVQGYGMTECSPVVSANITTQNDPASVGKPLPGVHVRLGENDELEVCSPGMMLGYWNNHQATDEVMTKDNWLRTGDKARISEDGYVYITGRIKDILILSNGEKIPPGDMEQAITLDPLFEQALVIGEARPFLGALVVINPEHWVGLAKAHNLDPFDKGQLLSEKLHRTMLKKVGECLHDFPGYAKVRRVIPLLEPWTVENGLLTPTLKIKRALVLHQYEQAINSMYGQ